MTALAMQIMQPSDYVVIDIETGNPGADVIDAAAKKWRPPANIKDPEKIAARRNEAREKIADRGALLDGAPVLCVAVKTPSMGIVFDAMSPEAPEIGSGWLCFSAGDEKSMLLSLREYLDKISNETTIFVGHSIRGFDAPKLRQRYLTYNLALPQILRPAVGDRIRPEMVDTMALGKSFSIEYRDGFGPSLNNLCAAIGVELPKQVITGADVPKMAERGEYEPIITYCAVDCSATERCFLLMTSTAADLS